MNKYSLEFLTWVDRCLFKDDFCKELVNIVGDEDIVFAVKFSSRWQKQTANICGFYQDYINSQEATAALEKYLQFKEREYEKI